MTSIIVIISLILIFILFVNVSDKLAKSQKEEQEAKRKKEIENRKNIRTATLTKARLEVYINYTERQDLGYHLYLSSPQWKETRRLILLKRGNNCEKCGIKVNNLYNLHLHHLTYEDLYNEYEEDLMLLCKVCHEKEHGIDSQELEEDFNFHVSDIKRIFNDLVINKLDRYEGYKNISIILQNIIKNPWKLNKIESYPYKESYELLYKITSTDMFFSPDDLINANKIVQNLPGVTEKTITTLSPSSESDIIDFLVKNIIKNNFTQEILSKFYPFSESQIDIYKEKLNWFSLSLNESLQWSSDLIEKFESKFDWDGLSGNNGLPWRSEVIEKFEHKWNWHSLSGNKTINWSKELLEKYEDKLDFKQLSGNPSLPWSVELIEKYEERWDWGYYDSWLNTDEKLFIPGLNSNEALSLSVQLVERFKNKWNFESLSSNKTKTWTIELIDKFKEKWDWTSLSGNESLPWSIELVGSFQTKWNKISLCMNPSVPWTIEFIEKTSKELIVFNYKDNNYAWGLTNNHGNIWSIKFLKNTLMNGILKV
jgi:5-methylcytosine-specific restriction endonuclease McrA